MPLLLLLAIPLAPLAAALVVGLAMAYIPRALAHRLTIGAVALSLSLSLYLLIGLFMGQFEARDITVYQWMLGSDFHFEVGFLVDPLSALMMVVVTAVSLAVHVYTIGYMRQDPGYCRFFCYISLFTFAMLMLVMANNFLQLFFGWEAVGLVSYLLIGFWYQKPSASYAGLKAFLVNRVGDLGFLLGIAALLSLTGKLDYNSVFGHAEQIANSSIAITANIHWPAMTLICLLLFIGAMGKSAQIPLHIWLPDSMEGPTPISALIHAATMVTAGIFMVARMSPLFEWSETALTVVLWSGTITAFAMGLLGLVQHDIKRVIAYSTLSQLGYMTAALGASAYATAIFHLVTHAFFKALLFLAAGSVIVALHHQQDMRRMGGLAKQLPITYGCALIGSLALIGFPGLAGFFSKDAIIEAVHLSTRPGATAAYLLLLGAAFVTAWYSFRLIFLVFHGNHRGHPVARENTAIITAPLLALALPSVILGAILLPALLFGDFFGLSLVTLPSHDGLARLAAASGGDVLHFTGHAMAGPTPYIALAGVALAWWLHQARGGAIWRRRGRQWLRLPIAILRQHYGFDSAAVMLTAATRRIGQWSWHWGDKAIIDAAVNGWAASLMQLSLQLRRLQSGYLFHYAFAIIIGLVLLLSWLWIGPQS